jgi:hypothetical protein
MHPPGLILQKRNFQLKPIKMKTSPKLTTIFILILTLSVRGFGQTVSDEEVLLQKFTDMKELKEQLPLNNDGTFKQLYILQDRVSFPAGINVKIAGRKIVLADKEQLANISDPYYLLFWDFRIDQNESNIGFMLMTRSGMDAKELVRVTAKAEKNGGEWVITESKVDKLR